MVVIVVVAVMVAMIRMPMIAPTAPVDRDKTPGGGKQRDRAN